MKRIKLTHSKHAIVDDEDFELLNKYSWCITPDGYAKRSWRDKKIRIVQNESMHRLIMKAKKGQLIDHINHNKLDNRKKNLRFCTRSESQRNRRKPCNNSTGFKGVYRSYSKNGKKWVAKITLGTFQRKIDAAKIYNEAAKKYFGEFAKLNKLP